MKLTPPAFSLLLIFFVSLPAGAQEALPATGAAEDHIKDVEQVAVEQQRGGLLPLIAVVEQTIAKNPQIKLARDQFASSRGAHQSASGQFDLFTQAQASGGRSYAPLIEGTELQAGKSHQRESNGSGAVALQNQLRTGQTLALTGQVNRFEDDLFNTTAPNYSSVAFSITQPLFRGRGRTATAAFEDAAGYQAEASHHDLRFTVNAAINGAVSAYWQFLAAREILSILVDSERNASKVTRQIKESKQPDSSMVEQTLANLLDRQRNRIDAENRLYTAQQALGLAMGIPTDEILMISRNLEQFPPTDARNQGLLDNWRDYVTNALAQRNDLAALKLRQLASKRLIDKAKNDRLPQLDAGISVGYAGLRESKSFSAYYDSYFDNVGGTNVLGTLTYQFPVQNNFAIGTQIQREAELRQLATQEYDLTRRIQTDVLLALEALRTNEQEVQISDDSVAGYQRAYELEQKALSEGKSNIILVYQAESLLTNAKVQRITSHLAYATALINLRFITATLINEEGEDNFRVDRSDLVTPP